MTSQERAAQVLDMKSAQQMGLMFADMIKEGFLKGYTTGQEDMRERAATVLDVDVINKADDLAGVRWERSYPQETAKQIRALPIE